MPMGKKKVREMSIFLIACKNFSWGEKLCPYQRDVLISRASLERRFRCVVEMYVRDESPLLCVGQCIIDAVSVQHC